MTHHTRCTPAQRAPQPRAVTLILTAGTLLLGLSACAPEPSDPVTLTSSEAGERYLGIVCPINEQWDALDLAVDTLRITAAGDPKASTREVQTQAAELLQQNRAALTSLTDPDLTWPPKTQPAIAEVAEALTAETTALQQLAQASTPAAVWSVAWPDPGESPALARAALGLPDTPTENCDRHREQQAQNTPTENETVTPQAKNTIPAPALRTP